MSSEPMVSVGIRSLTDGVVCEIRLIAPADAFRGELVMALESGRRATAKRLDGHYDGSTPPTPWRGAAEQGGQQ